VPKGGRPTGMSLGTAAVESPLALLLSIIVDDIVPVLLVASIGFLLARYARLDVKMLSRLTFLALSPCLVFKSLVGAQLGAEEFGKLALFALALTAGIGVIAWSVARLLRLDRTMTSAFCLVVMFANAGNYGLPLVLFAFGQEALARATVIFAVNAALMYTVGVFLACQGRLGLRGTLASVARVPAIYGVALAIVVLATGFKVPAFIMRPVGLVGDAALPCMLMVLGMQFERAGRLEHLRLVGVSSALKLIVAPAMAFLLVALLGISGPGRQAALVQAGTPAAVLTTILAVQYDVAPSLVTGAVFVSTLLSPLTMAVLVALAKGG
jgi:malate permease and related proteins